MHLRTHSRKWWSGIFLFYILYTLDRFLMAIRECHPRSRSSVWGCFVCCSYRIVDGLVAFVFLLNGFLHVEVELSLPLDTLLLHVADDTFMHSLCPKSRLASELVSRCWPSTGNIVLLFSFLWMNMGVSNVNIYLFLKLLLVMDEDDGAGGEQGRSR